MPAKPPPEVEVEEEYEEEVDESEEEFDVDDEAAEELWDDAIRALRKRQKARSRQLKEAWARTAFSAGRS